MSPKVSVLIASYNYARYLPITLDSALAQTFEDFEVVVVDDGSSDDTPGAVAPYLGDPRVHFHRIEHAGHPAAKNRCLAEARGEYIAFLDADDLWLPTKLEKQLAAFQADPGLGVVYSRRSLIDSEGRDLKSPLRSLHRGTVLGPLLTDNFVCFSSAMVRRSVIDEVGRFDETLVHPIDYDLWLRIGLRYRFEYIDEPLVKYRRHASMSQTDSHLKRRPEIDRVTNRFLDEYGGRAAVSPALVREAAAARSCHLALEYRNTKPLRSLAEYLRALGACPSYRPAWRGLLALPIPESLRRAIRARLGRPADWRNLELAAPAQVGEPTPG